MKSSAARRVMEAFLSKCPRCAKVIRDPCCACGRAQVDEGISPWVVRCCLCGFYIHELDIEQLSTDPSCEEMEAFITAQISEYEADLVKIARFKADRARVVGRA